MVISADRPVAGLGSVAGTGSLSVTVNETTTFGIEAQSSGGRARGLSLRAEVFPATGGSTQISSLASDAGVECTTFEGLLHWVARVTLSPAAWDTRLHVGTVRLPLSASRPVIVLHPGGSRGVVRAGAPADFGGLPVAGTWTLATPLAPGETCGTPGTTSPGQPASVAPQMIVVADLSCR